MQIITFIPMTLGVVVLNSNISIKGAFFLKTELPYPKEYPSRITPNPMPEQLIGQMNSQ